MQNLSGERVQRVGGGWAGASRSAPGELGVDRIQGQLVPCCPPPGIHSQGLAPLS